MRKVFIILSFLLLSILPVHSSNSGIITITKISSSDIVSHSGRTDRYGCHNDRKRGTYHCH